MLHDLGHAWRAIARNRGFVLVAVLSLGLGIGANTAIFGFLNALLLRPLPYPNPASLVDVSETSPTELCAGCGVGTSWPAFQEWRARARSFERLDAYRERHVALADQVGLPEVVGATEVSAGLLESLGAIPAAGRLVGASDDRTGATPVAVLSHRLWARRYGADTALIGRTIRIDGQPTTVVGVMRPRFAFPEFADVWLPITPARPAQARDDRSLSVLGRLRPGVSMEAAGREMAVVASQQGAADPATYRGWTAVVEPYRTELQDPIVNLAFAVALGAATLVLLIACANLANLQLARGASRVRELAIRLATGASRGQILRQLLVESVTISLLGGVAALLVAVWGVRAVTRLIGSQIPLWIDLSFDWRVFVFAVLVAVGAGILFGILPALRAAGVDVQAALRTGAAGLTAGRRESRFRDALAVVQVTLATVLLIGAGLAVRAFVQANRTGDLGYDPAGVLRADLELAGRRYDDPGRVATLTGEALARLRATGGVAGTALEHVEFLGTFVGQASRVSIEGPSQPVPNDRAPRFGFAVTAGYFELLGIPVVEGRAFTADDRPGAPAVAIVNQATAARLWPGERALGKRIRLGTEPGSPWFEVVGVVANVITPPARYAPPFVYVAFSQAPARPVTLLARASSGRAAGLAEPVRRVIADLDPDQPVQNVLTMEQHLRLGLAPIRVMLGLMSTLGLIALLLAGFGLYAVLAYLVARRVRELGIRMALGASDTDLLRLVLGRGGRLAGVAIGLGVPLAWLLARVLRHLLYSVRADDPLVFVAVPLFLMAIALVASWTPARRAAAVDPVVALREE